VDYRGICEQVVYNDISGELSGKGFEIEVLSYQEVG
jgi:hypothetical protein